MRDTILMISMRDDIHRKTSLPKFWRALVRACADPRRFHEREACTERALRSEISEIDPGLIRDAVRSLERPSLFAQPQELCARAKKPIEQEFVNQVEQLRRTPGATVDDALTRTLERSTQRYCRDTMCNSNLKPREAREIAAALRGSVARCDIPRLVAQRELPRMRKSKPHLDYNADLRGGL